MAMQDWIDTLTKVWEIDNGKGGTLRSYPLYEKDSFPEELPTQEACVLTFIEGVRFVYSAGGPVYGVWKGRSEFHLTQSAAKSNLPFVNLFFHRILQAAAQNIQLGGAVGHFLLDQSGEGGSNIQGPVTLQYGSEDPHLGLVAFWKVKEHIESEITVSA